VTDEVNLTLASLDARLSALRDALPRPPVPPPARAAGDVPGSPDPNQLAPTAGGAPHVPPSPAPPAAGIAELVQWSDRLGQLVVELTALRDDIDGRLTLLRAASAQASGPAGSADSGAAGQPADPGAGVPTPYDRVFAGRVVLDAGPFADIIAVTKFHRALERLPAAREVSLVGFTADRAEVEIELGVGVALGQAIRLVVPFDFTILQTDDARLELNVAPARAPVRRRPKAGAA
jgi:hypothetical protein